MLFLLLFVQWGTDNLEMKHYVPRQNVEFFRAESTHAFDVLHYELDVSLPMTSRSIEGTNTISCRSRENGLTTAILHAYTLNIDSVIVDGTSTTFSTSGESLSIDLPQTYNAGDSFDICIGYNGTWSVSYNQTGFVYYPENYNSSTLHAIAYTLGEPWDARRWMPCYDEPYDKADYGCVLNVTVPDSFVVCGNGELVSVTYNADNTVTYTWQEMYPITTYLMHFGVSIYAVWSQWWHSTTGDSIEIRHWIWPEDSAQSITSFQHMPDAMTLYDSLYGEYPFDRYGQDVVYPYAWGGMEHQEMTTIHRIWLLNGSEQGMAHELSHQWWGDMVTCVDFRDIWLNEGCATYSDANYWWYRFGLAQFNNCMQERATYYFQEDNAWRHPLYDPPLSELFNYGYTYCKAMWVMHMLRYLDQDNFFNAMHTYRDSFEYSTANTEDLKAVFSQVYGTDLTWFFDEWVYGQGHPEYEVYWYCAPSGNDYAVSMNIYQVQTNAPAVFHMPVEITLHSSGSDTTVSIPVNSSPTHVDYTLADSVTSITFDPDYWLLDECDIYYGAEELVQDNPTYNDLFFSTNPARRPEIHFVISQPGHVQVLLYDVSGRISRTVFSEQCDAGQYNKLLTDLSAGVYFCRLKTSSNELVKKLVIVD